MRSPNAVFNKSSLAHPNNAHACASAPTTAPPAATMSMPPVDACDCPRDTITGSIFANTVTSLLLKIGGPLPGVTVPVRRKFNAGAGSLRWRARNERDTQRSMRPWISALAAAERTDAQCPSLPDARFSARRRPVARNAQRAFHVHQCRLRGTGTGSRRSAPRSSCRRRACAIPARPRSPRCSALARRGA